MVWFFSNVVVPNGKRSNVIFSSAAIANYGCREKLSQSLGQKYGLEGAGQVFDTASAW
jgi:hypothetical protein